MARNKSSAKNKDEIVAKLQARIEELEAQLKEKESVLGSVTIKNVSGEYIYLPNYKPNEDGYVLKPDETYVISGEWLKYLQGIRHQSLTNGALIFVDKDNVPEQIAEQEVTDDDIRKWLKLSKTSFAKKIADFDSLILLRRIYSIGKELTQNENDEFPSLEGHLETIRKQIKKLFPEIVEID